jgi:hypothetical protein
VKIIIPKIEIIRNNEIGIPLIELGVFCGSSVVCDPEAVVDE